MDLSCITVQRVHISAGFMDILYIVYADPGSASGSPLPGTDGVTRT
jgi:hypothetical protein